MATDVYGTVPKGGTATCMARVAGEDAAAINQTTIATAAYSVFLLDEHDPDARWVVDGHDGESLTPSEIIFNTLQTDERWTVDDTGYNFLHTIDVSADEAFAVAGRNYLAEYRLVPTTGQVVIVRFRLNCI